MSSFAHSNSYENCFKVRINRKGLQQVGGGQRGIIQGLSKGGRRRLLFLCNQLHPEQESLFVTLTLKDWVDDFKQWKKWLNRTLQGLRYHFPSMSGIWRLEFQKRGCPHYHLILFPSSGEDLNSVRGIVRKYWSKAVGTSNVNLTQGIQVEKVRNIRKCGFYLAIYSSKDEQDRKDIPTGRVWGKINAKKLPIGDYGGESVDNINELVWIKRLYRRYLLANGCQRGTPLLNTLCNRESSMSGFGSRQFQRKLFRLSKQLADERYLQEFESLLKVA